jgi:solute carrier family 13 (sodium-dependent dicarboxylate transporter), member 2/3/5
MNSISGLRNFFSRHSDDPWVSILKIILGPLAAILINLFIEIDPAKPQLTYMLSIAIWMALWWVTEAIPIAVTAILPFILFPVFGIMSTNDIAPLYMNQVIFLFIGGFIIAIAMEKWNLHKRIALRIIMSVGNNPGRILFSFMFASFFLSMWISNTATVMMMLPTTLAVVYEVNKQSGQTANFSIALLLGIAYASSIGGTATLVGTPPNLIFLSNYIKAFPGNDTVNFTTWFMFGFPTAIILLIVAYYMLKRIFMHKQSYAGLDPTLLKEEYKELGKINYEEKVVFGVFIITALLWFTRADLQIGDLLIPGWGKAMPNPEFYTDATVAVFMAIVLFIIPSRNQKGKMVMDTKSLAKIPFGVILLFGGGFALAEGFVSTGLSQWMADRLSVFGVLPPFVLVLGIATFMNFFTEFTSNTASAQIFLPVILVMSQTIGVDPLLVMIPVTFAASFAFMLPIATPANMIVFGSDMIKVKDMIKAGLWLNIAGSVIVTIMMFLWGKIVFGIQ